MIRVLTILLILTASIGYSQGITPEQKLEAVRNAQKVEVLESDLTTAELVIMSQKEVIKDLTDEVNRIGMINNLIQSNYSILETQYEALKAKRDPKYSFADFLQDAGKIGIGVLIGVIGVLVL